MAILESSLKQIHSSAPMTGNQFSIEASPEAFEILSDRIYPNKVRAVVRELNTNANDATIDAAKVKKVHELVKQGRLVPAPLQFHFVPNEDGGTVKQFLYPDFSSDVVSYVGDNSRYIHKELDILFYHPNYDLTNWERKTHVVHMPNRLEPFFSVRDYGTGLSHEKIMKMYTTYFASDKNTSNDYTGCLGLGSKSPFAYTDHFTVESFWNGEKRVYTATLKEGFPHIDIFKNEDGSEKWEPTTEPNGLNVQFVVKTSDIYNFDEEAERLFPYFKITPDIVGNTILKSKLMDIHTNKLDGKYYALHDDELGFGVRYYDGRGPLAVMGSIAYPIKIDNIPYDLPNREIIRAILNSNIDIRFNIGELQIAPSREQLSYKDSTVTNILNKLKTVAGQLSDLVRKKIEEKETLWDARVGLRTLFDDHSVMNVVNSVNTGKLTWRGIPVGAAVNLSFDKKITKTDEAGKTITELMPESDYPWVLSLYARESRKGVNAVAKVVDEISPSADLNIFEIDIPRGVSSRINYYYNNNGGKNCFTVSFKDKTSRELFITRLGMKPDTQFKLVSSLPQPPQAERKSYANVAQLFVYKEHYREQKTQYVYWGTPSNAFKIDDGGIYVEMLRNKTINESGADVHPHNLKYIIEGISKVSGNSNNEVVIGVRKKVVDLFRTSDEWVSIWEYARNILRQADTKSGLSQHAKNLSELNNINYVELYLSIGRQLDTDGAVVDETNDFVKFIRKVQELNKSNKFKDAVKNFNGLATLVAFKNEAKPVHAIQDEIVALLDKYTMFKYAFDSLSFVTDSSWKDLYNYISSIDKR